MCNSGLFLCTYLHNLFLHSFSPGVHSSGKIWEVCSLIPPHVHMIALTATATVTTPEQSHRYSKNGRPIYSSNITSQTKHCILGCRKVPLEITFAPLIDELCRRHCHMHRVIIFCQRYDKCVALYKLF